MSTHLTSAFTWFSSLIHVGFLPATGTLKVWNRVQEDETDVRSASQRRVIASGSLRACQEMACPPEVTDEKPIRYHESNDRSCH